MKAAFLIRCSTDQQDYKRQIEDLQRVAERFDYLCPEELVFGEYITGRDDVTIGNRRSIKRLLEAAKKHEMDVLLIAEVSRLSRDSLSGRYYVRELCNAGIPTYFRDKGKWTIDPTTGKLDEGFIKELGTYFDGAAEYLKSMKTQVASGRRSKLRENQLVIGHVPIGYKKLGGKDRHTKSTLVVDPERATIVVDMFNMYAQEGASLKSVVLQISAKYGERHSVSHVYQILCRDLYWTGEYTIFMNDPDDKDKDPEPFSVKLESPLIDKELYEKVTAKRLAQRASKVPYPVQQVHLLSRLIKCPSCGHSFSPCMRSGDGRGTRYRMSNGKLAYTWKCMSRINNASDCDCHINLNNEKLEGIFWAFIKRELISYADTGSDRREQKMQESLGRIRDLQEDVQLYEKEIETANKKIERAYNVYIDAPEGMEEDAKNRYSKTVQEYHKNKLYASSRIEELKSQIGMLQNQIDFLKTPIKREEFIARIEKDEAEKRKVFLQLIYQIVPYKVKYRVVVMEVQTIAGMYYFLFNANQKRTSVAYYLDYIFGRWQASNNRLEAYEPGDYFMLQNPSSIMDTEEADLGATYEEVEDICKANNWILDPEFESPVSKQEF